MKTFCLTFALLAATGIPLPAAAVDVNQLEGASWYLFVDVEMMRRSEAGRGIYAWLENEVLADIAKETEIDLRGKLRRVSAFGDGPDDGFVELEGDFDDRLQKRFNTAAAPDAKTASHRGKAYFRVDRESFASAGGETRFRIDGPWFFSFALPKRLIVTQSEARMKALLETGKSPKRPTPGEALFVLEGEKRLVQAGADAQRLAKLERGAGWDSQILKNTKKVGLLLADDDGKLALDLRLHAEEREKAVSLRNVVLGLVGLSMFNDELDPNVAALLRSVDVSLDGSALRLRVAARPELFLNAVK